MTTYDLSNRQKQLLKLLVENIRDNKIAEEIAPEIGSEHCYIEGLNIKFGRNFIWDMEALCDAKLMECTFTRYSSQANRIYTVTQTGYKAVADDFVIPEEPEETSDNSEAVFAGINIEKIQAMWFLGSNEISELMNNPSLLEKTVETITNQLLEVIEPEISSYKLKAYERNLQDLKRQLISNSPSPTTLQRQFITLSFMESIGGSISLATKVWPYLYPLLIIADYKIPEE